MTRRVMWAAVGALFCLVVVSGCVAHPPRVVADSIVRVAVSDSLTSLAPGASTQRGDSNTAIASLTRDQFFVYDANEQLVPNPSWGTAVVLDSDGFDVTYTLAESAQWSDGVPVTAVDLLLSWVAGTGALDALLDETTFDAPASVPLADPPLFPAVSADGRALTVYYGADVSGWETLLDVQLPAHVVAKVALGIDDPSEASSAVIDAILQKDAAALTALAEAWNTAFAIAPEQQSTDVRVSSGPYRIEAVTETAVTLVANEKYLGSRQPRIQTIELVTIENPLDAVRALGDGTVDVVTPTPSPDVQRALLAIDDATVITGRDTAIEHLDLQIENGRSGVFADPIAREAFLLALPRQQIASELVGTYFEDATAPSSFLIDQSSPDYAAVSRDNGSAAYGSSQPQEAAALLASAGLSSPEVCILFDASDENRLREFQLIAADATAAGFVVSDCSSDDVASQLGSAGAYDAALFAWNDPQTTTSWISDLYSTSGANNLTGYSSATVDRLVEELGGATEPEARFDVLSEIDAELWSDAYGAPLFQHPAFTAFGPSVTGVTGSTLSAGVFWNATEWMPVPRQ